MDFPAALYLDKCEADGGLKVYVKATVMENGQRFASYDTVDFERPSLIMEVNVGFDLLTKLACLLNGQSWAQCASNEITA